MNEIDIAILCPLQEEFEIALSLLQAPEIRQVKNSRLTFQCGEYADGEKKWLIGLFLTGQGINTLERITDSVISHLKPQYIFLFGIAGGIKDVNIGDVVICNKFYGYEAGRETNEGFKPRPEAGKPSKKVFILAKSLVLEYERKHKDHRVKTGPIASGHKLLAGSQSETVRLIKRVYNDTLAVEREAIGFYEAARDSGVEFLNIRGISDLIDKKEETEFNGSRVLAMKNATSFLSFLIDRLPGKPLSFSAKSPSENSIAIKYLPKAFATWMRSRPPQTGQLAFLDFGLRVNLESGEAVEIENIKGIEQYKMPGDIKANWIKIVFFKAQKEETIYLSEDTRFPGWGALVGGSSKLFNALEAAFSKQSINR